MSVYALTYRKRLLPIRLAATLLALVPLLEAEQLDKVSERHLLESADRAVIGDTEAVLAGKVEPDWLPVTAQSYLMRKPFSLWVPYTNSAVVSEWQSREAAGQGWPLILFAVFSDPAKTNLVDALLYNGSPGVLPLVDGQYNKWLHAIRTNDSMAKVFATLGRKNCDYFLGADDRWRVRVTYLGANGEFIDIEADACSGKVLQVRDVTL